MKSGLGTQLRHLIELLDGDVAQTHADAGLDYRPRYNPVLRVSETSRMIRQRSSRPSCFVFPDTSGKSSRDRDVCIVRGDVYDVHMTTRERLFAAAKEIFERDGLDALTIRAVGRQAGMSAMAIYRHFPDKDALIDALMEDGFVAWEAIVGEIDSEDAILWLKRVVASYSDFALADPHRFDAAFLLPAPGARTFPGGFEAGRSPVVNKVIAQIEIAQAQGRISDESPLQLTLLLSALAQGLVSMHRAGRFCSDDQFRMSYQFAMERLLAGFMKDNVAVQSTSKTRKGKRA